ncbi:unnamed protein product [Cylicocyclus nassatus]|uniref:Uncharacterized protein n=1 Tax=Cylicocyclus nassatus TaxID=53992 RepID=A0AA36H091_CYLNA|nr:unnamed protein product [Cylicocyclus nassatus]
MQIETDFISVSQQLTTIIIKLTNGMMERALTKPPRFSSVMERARLRDKILTSRIHPTMRYMHVCFETMQRISLTCFEDGPIDVALQD